MSTLREAAQQALEALDAGVSVSPRSVLHDRLRAALAQQEQEPVAWIHKLHYLLGHAENMPPADRALALGWEPLYTHPPRREWQGLTDEIIDSVWPSPEGTNSIRAVAYAIEAALKEKNNE